MLNCSDVLIIKPIDLKLHTVILDKSLYECSVSEFYVTSSIFAENLTKWVSVSVRTYILYGRYVFR